MLLTFILSFIFTFNNATVVEKVSTTAETYHIIHIKGIIINKSTGKTLMRGSKVKSSDKIAFKGSTSKAVVLGTKRGRFILSATKAKKTGNEFVAFVSSVVSPLKTNAKLSTRGTQEKLQDLGKHFGERDQMGNVPTFAVIGEEYSFAVSTLSFPLDGAKKTGLVLLYKLENGKKRVSGLGYKGDVITISKQKHFLGKGISPENVEFIQLRKLTEGKFMDKLSKENDKEEYLKAEFELVFVSESNLKADLTELINTLDEGKMTDKEKFMESYFFVSDVYGNVDVEDLVNFVADNGITSKRVEITKDLLEELDRQAVESELENEVEEEGTEAEE